jgi:predicted transcriptional regulator
MRSKTRANDLIKSQILKICAGGATKTRITHAAKPNSMKLISYLLLIDEGLIEVVNDGNRIIHKTTPKGLGLVVGLERFHGDADKMLINQCV